MTIFMPSKDPGNVEPYYVVWCDEDGTNTGGAGDDGELQGATISTTTWILPDGITRDSSSQAAVTIRGIVYAINTVCTIWLSSGTDGVDYDLLCRIVTSDSRTLEQIITIPVRSA